MNSNQTKICIHCKSVIPAGAVNCPICGKSQKSHMDLVIVAVIFIVFWILASLITGGNIFAAELAAADPGAAAETVIETSIEEEDAGYGTLPLCFR